MCEVSVGPHWTVKDLKRAIAEATSILKHEQRLLWADHALVGTELLEDVVATGVSPVRVVRVDPTWIVHLDKLAAAGVLMNLDSDFKDDLETRNALDVLLQDRSFVLAAVQENGSLLYHLSQELRNDREVVLAAVRENGASLAFAPEGLRGDREAVLVALQQNGMALQHASEELRGSRDVAEVAVQECGEALRYVSEELKSDGEFVLSAVRRSPEALLLAALHLQKDQSFVVRAVKANGDALRFVCPELSRNVEVVQAAEAYWRERAGQVEPSTSPRRADVFLSAAARARVTNYEGRMKSGGGLGERAHP